MKIRILDDAVQDLILDPKIVSSFQEPVFQIVSSILEPRTSILRFNRRS